MARESLLMSTCLRCLIGFKGKYLIRAQYTIPTPRGQRLTLWAAHKI
jgi:hypothetical protein